MAIRTLKVSNIHRNPNQPREHFDEEALQELAASIMEFGLIQPIEVRKDAKEGGYEIVAGERRWRAHQIAEIATIKAIVSDAHSDADEIAWFERSVAENVNRADMTPVEEGHAFARIMEERDQTAAEVASKFGKTTQYVNMRLKMVDLITEIQDLVSQGKIPVQAAVQIAALSIGNQRSLLAEWARGKFANDNELVHFAFAMKEQQDQEVLMIVEDMTPEEREKRVKERAATRSKLDQIERLAALLAEIGKSDPQELAVALEGEVGSRIKQLDRVAAALKSARFTMRQTKAHAEARKAIVTNPDAETTPQTETEVATEPATV
jgi:ParB family chromosome partitioning protein